MSGWAHCKYKCPFKWEKEKERESEGALCDHWLKVGEKPGFELKEGRHEPRNAAAGF